MMVASTHPSMAVREFPAAAPRTKTSLGVAAGLSVVLIAVLWFAGSGSLLLLAIPAMATFFALVLYFRYPILYVQYSLWVWFLAPLVRRIVDFRFGWTDPNLILLSPLLVSGVTGLAFLRKDGKAWSDIPVGFVLCGAAIFYGLVVGMLLHASTETAYGLLNWLCPMLFGLHLYRNWTQYETYRSATSSSFLWGALVLGLYGIYQFLQPPAWDRFWLEGVKAAMTGGSFGLPEPLMIRVWSTMNAPGPFANTMMVALLFILGVRSPIKLPAAIVGYTSFLLSVVRTAWLSWIIGLVWILKNSKPRVMVRFVLSGALLIVCLLPLLSDPRMANVIGDRVKTFTDLREDESFGDRLEMYRVLTNDVTDNPFGHGLKNLESSHGMAVDSGILTVVFSLGWLGSLLFAAGIVSLFLMKKSWMATSDEFPGIAKAIMIAILVQVIGGNVFVSVTGAMFWMLAGMYLAAGKYHIERS
jgi:hypothetical protein